MSGVLIHSYRFGFNGQEKDDEIFNVTGSSYTAEFWQYDSRLGRRWNIDPVVKPWESSYAAFRNNPIWYADPSGLDGEQTGDERTNDNGDTEVYVEGQGWTGDAEVCGNCPDNYVEKLPEEPTVLYKISSYFRNLDVKMTGGGDFTNFSGWTITNKNGNGTPAIFGNPKSEFDGTDVIEVLDMFGSRARVRGLRPKPKSNTDKVNKTTQGLLKTGAKAGSKLSNSTDKDVQAQVEKQDKMIHNNHKISWDSSSVVINKADSIGETGGSFDDNWIEIYKKSNKEVINYGTN